MKEKFKNFRYKLAYLIAPDWIDDLEHRFSVFLCEQTGGKMSKCYYTLDAMRSVASDYQQSICDECEYRNDEKVVFCKDCVYCKSLQKVCTCPTGAAGTMMSGYDYCSQGKRKENVD